MPRFRVTLHGRNLSLIIDGAPQRVGFVTTRIVDSSDERGARAQALDLVRLHPLVQHALDDPRLAADPALVMVASVEEVSRDEPIPKTQPGLSFYPAAESPEPPVA